MITAMANVGWHNLAESFEPKDATYWQTTRKREMFKELSKVVQFEVSVHPKKQIEQNNHQK